jgi:predicted ATPase
VPVRGGCGSSRQQWLALGSRSEQIRCQFGGSLLRLAKLYVRFFRSFNYDYERKAHPKAKAYEWERTEDRWFPFVNIVFDPMVTAVVGANESGKSHLIAAIQQGLTGSGIKRDDFCRYSPLYSVENGKRRDPDLAVVVEVEADDQERLAEAGVAASVGQHLTLLRLYDTGRKLLGVDGSDLELGDDQIDAFEQCLPVPFELETDIALPDTVTLDALIDGSSKSLPSRRNRAELAELFAAGAVDVEEVKQEAERIAGLFSLDERSTEETNRMLAEQDLARKLMREIAQIDIDSFKELRDALKSEDEGRVAGLREQMNRSLARHLNFARWWRQDKDFQLRVDTRDLELVFTIRDRTGTDYSFKERSRGLKYFLGYYVQLLAHKSPAGRREVLLMDEPDAYLSSMGQQDLLRTLEHYAEPEDSARRDQVVYVTHSPFLINKNAAHRIRVLAKGSEDEGTRVVRDPARNHYEPLRSSIGTYVAETAFIGGSNLVVEGVSDQILLAGLASYLRRQGVPGSQLIDLNEVTIVPAASAGEVPYIIYLARGRDEIKPPCVALLDGDEAGRDAGRKLTSDKFGAKLDPTFVIDLAKWAEDADGLKLADGITVVEIEDLIPTRIAAEAGRQYAERLLRVSGDDLAKLKADDIEQALNDGDGGLWKALKAAFSEAYDGHIDKTGFAKEVVRIVERDHGGRKPDGLPGLEHNFAQLIEYLAESLSAAERAEDDRRRNKRVRHLVKEFLDDYQGGAKRDDASRALKNIEASLDEADLADEAIHREIARLRKEFKLASDPLQTVEEFENFRERLRALPYQERLAHQEGEPASEG